MTSKRESLRPLGWNDYFECQLATIHAQNQHIARVISVQRNLFLMNDGEKEWLCSPAGKLLHGGDYPVTGDWAVVADKIVTGIVPRRNMLSRAEAGSRGSKNEVTAREQSIAANLDKVFIVCGLDRDFNVRRIERYLTLVYNCSISPVIVLTKADLHPHPDACRDEVEQHAFGVPVILASINSAADKDALESHLGSGQTVAMLGSSGAGKSTLINKLCGRTIQLTAPISSSVHKGRHTTTTRELIPMPPGGLLMDNPGIREIAFFQDGDGIDTAFTDIVQLAAGCRFVDCTHQHEPGCAVRRSVETDGLQPERLESYHKMQREMQFIAERHNKGANRAEKDRWQHVARLRKQLYRQDR